MGFKLAASLVLLAVVSRQAAAADVYYDIPVQRRERPGVPRRLPRDAIQAGTFPGQLIIANKGDVLHLNVTNKLENPSMRRSTSIHWHGIFQSRTASEDGPSFVNQCPIAPGAFYQYNFPLLEQTGTFWFHSHLSTQYIDGERGLLVICDPNDPQKALWDVDDASTIITLADWYHKPAEELMAQFKIDDKEPVPDSGLINGVGRYVGGPAVPWAVVNVVKGKRYRLRVINISGFAAFTFSIQDHTFEVIEADGIATVPLTVDTFLIHAAQRYSVVLNANQKVANYWINAPMTAKGSSATLNKDNVKAILRYAGAPIQDPPTAKVVVLADPVLTATKKKLELEESNLATLINPGAPGGSGPADHVIDLKFGTAGPGTWDINGISYVPPTLPRLLNIINGASVASDFAIAENTFILSPDEVVELRIHGSNNGITHPFHLHGHTFDVVKGSSGKANYVNPIRRDVVAVDSGGVIIRFRGKLSGRYLRPPLILCPCLADNPGPWFLHCHIDWHLEAGLAVVFAERPADVRAGPKSNIITPQWLDLCPAYNALPTELQ
ncbi:laccase [Mycena vulgaris]|nr:laccase [Mycena vulgaris]